MLQIRKEQILAMQNECHQRFVLRMIEHLQEQFADFVKDLRDDLPLHLFVRKGIERASSYGLIYENQIERFLECMAILGFDFDREQAHPWAQKILQREGASGEAKIDELCEYMIFAREETLHG